VSTQTFYETRPPNTSQPPEHESEQPPLLLAPSRGQQLTGLLGRLAKIYHLDVHDTSLLTRRAAIEMGYVALMLTIIFVFDLAAWTLLWNMIFHAGKMQFGLLTPLAVFCGLIFAAMIFIYERQFMTADTYKRWRYVWWPVTIRLIVIAVAAAITTQPVEVMVFKGPIERRVHEESVRIEALSRLSALEKAQKETQGATGLKDTVAWADNEDAKNKSEEARQTASALRSQRETEERNLRGAQAALSSARNALARARTQGQAAYANSRIQSASTRIGQIQSNISSIDEKLRGSEDNEKYWNEQHNAKSDELKKNEQAAKDDVRRLQNWIAQLRKSAPGEEVVENIDKTLKWEFQDQEYDFFQRLGVINDLYFGRPARWPDATAEDRKKLADEYKLKDIGSDDKEAEARRMADAHTFMWSYWAVVGIAAVIPLLVLALKGLLPKDLKIYYSTEEQKAAGNYESWKFESKGGRLVAVDNADAV
jgi:predicted  nucleic acid-binding Zn-ribbon protein